MTSISTTAMKRPQRKKHKLEIDPLKVRGLLIMKGSSQSDFAKRHGWSFQMVSYAINGGRRGPMARKIIAKLKEELGL